MKLWKQVNLHSKLNVRRKMIREVIQWLVALVNYINLLICFSRNWRGEVHYRLWIVEKPNFCDGDEKNFLYFA